MSQERRAFKLLAEEIKNAVNDTPPELTITPYIEPILKQALQRAKDEAREEAAVLCDKLAGREYSAVSQLIRAQKGKP